MTSRRPQKVAALIQSELARLLVEDIDDPSLRDVAITEVQVSNDLKNVFVYFEKRVTELKKIEEGLKRAIPFFKRRIAENLNLRYVPELHFKLDTHSQSVSRVFSLLDQLGSGSEKST